MSRRKFRLTAPKNWERKKYEQRSLASNDVDMPDSGPLMVKIPREIADTALLTLQVSHTGFDGWTRMYVTVNAVRFCMLEHHESTSRVVMTLDLKMGICTLLVERKKVKLSPERVSTLAEFTELVKMIDRHNICQGITDKKFAPLISKRGGTFVDPYGMQDVVFCFKKVDFMHFMLQVIVLLTTTHSTKLSGMIDVIFL